MNALYAIPLLTQPLGPTPKEQKALLASATDLALRRLLSWTSPSISHCSLYGVWVLRHKTLSDLENDFTTERRGCARLPIVQVVDLEA